MNEQQGGNKMNQWVVAIIVVLVVVIGSSFLFGNRTDRTTRPGQNVEEGVLRGKEVTGTVAEGQDKTAVEEGHIIGAFPNELLIAVEGSDLMEGGDTIVYRTITRADVEDSYAIHYTEDGSEQLTASYTSGGTMFDNVEAFRVYFAENGWDIRQYADPDSVDTTFYYATRGLEGVTVTFVMGDRGITIKEAYTIASEDVFADE